MVLLRPNTRSVASCALLNAPLAQVLPNDDEIQERVSGDDHLLQCPDYRRERIHAAVMATVCVVAAVMALWEAARTAWGRISECRPSTL